MRQRAEPGGRTVTTRRAGLVVLAAVLTAGAAILTFLAGLQKEFRLRPTDG